MRKLLSLLLLLAATITASAADPTALAYQTFATATLVENPTATSMADLGYAQTQNGDRSYTEKAPGTKPVIIPETDQYASSTKMSTSGVVLSATANIYFYVTGVSQLDLYVFNNSKNTAKVLTAVATPVSGEAVTKTFSNDGSTNGRSNKGELTLDPTASYTIKLSADQELVLYAFRFTPGTTLTPDGDPTYALTEVKVNGQANATALTALNSAKTYDDATAYDGMPTLSYTFTKTQNYQGADPVVTTTTNNVTLAADANDSKKYTGTFSIVDGGDAYTYNFTNVDYKTLYTLATASAVVKFNETHLKSQGYFAMVGTPAFGNQGDGEGTDSYYDVKSGRGFTFKVTGVKAFTLKYKNANSGEERHATVQLGSDAAVATPGVKGGIAESQVFVIDDATAETTITISSDESKTIYPLSVTLYQSLPTQSITLAGQYGTAVATQDLDFSQAQVAAYVLSAINDGTLTLTKVDAVKKGDAFLARGAAGSYNIPAATTTPTDTNLFLAGAGAAVSGACALTGNDTDGYCFAPCAATTAVPEGKAYFVPAAGQAAARYTFDFGTTAISALAAATQAAAPVKRIVNGQILIGNYNALGQQVR